jgi:hypothetical protein
MCVDVSDLGPDNVPAPAQVTDLECVEQWLGHTVSERATQVAGLSCEAAACCWSRQIA